ncbi:MAG: hypothetical protein WAW37_01465 [Syntrophobacteraceae bacterium]
MKRFFILLAAVALLAASLPAHAQEMLPPDPNRSGDFTSQYMGEKIWVDVFIMRPISFAASLIGLGTAVVAYPFAAMSNSTDRVEEELIRKPFAYTFTRSVGDIDF